MLFHSHTHTHTYTHTHTHTHTYVHKHTHTHTHTSHRYIPPFLWGKSGHMQTIVFGAIGRFLTPWENGVRHSIIVPDGSTVYYDIFEPDEVKHENVMMFVCPG